MQPSSQLKYVSQYGSGLDARTAQEARQAADVQATPAAEQLNRLSELVETALKQQRELADRLQWVSAPLSERGAVQVRPEPASVRSDLLEKLNMLTIQVNALLDAQRLLLGGLEV